MELNFQNIVDKIQVILPEKWIKAIFMVEYTSGSYSMRCFSDSEDGHFIDCIDVEGQSKLKVIKTYKEINEEIKKCRNELEGEKLWYALTISFDADGKFKSEFDYNSHEENVISYIEEWKKRYISI